MIGDARPGAPRVGTVNYVDLSQEWYSGMSTSRAHGVPEFTVKEHHTPAVEDIVITHVSMSAHNGTHVDAARHFFPDGLTIDEYPIARFQGTGVVVDVRRDGPVGVGAAEIEATGVEFEPGDFALLYFGFAERFGTPEYDDHPHLTLDAAEYLVEKGVSLVGVDTITPDLCNSARGPDFAFPVHKTLLGNDVLIIENLGTGLRELLGRRVAVHAAPLAIRGGDGAPARVFARAD